MWEAEFAAAPAKWLGLRATYYKMDSFHRHPANPAIFEMGTNRGHHFQGRADVVFGQNWRGHFVMESMLPGDFYRARGRAYFVRWEVIYTIQKRVAIPTVGTLFDRMLR